VTQQERLTEINLGQHVGGIHDNLLFISQAPSSAFVPLRQQSSG
jgi:hypothetical protein